MKIKVLTEENWVLKKGSVHEVDKQLPNGAIVIKSGLDLVQPVLFKGEYEIIDA